MALSSSELGPWATSTTTSSSGCSLMSSARDVRMSATSSWLSSAVATVIGTVVATGVVHSKSGSPSAPPAASRRAAMRPRSSISGGASSRLPNRYSVACITLLWDETNSGTATIFVTSRSARRSTASWIVRLLAMPNATSTGRSDSTCAASSRTCRFHSSRPPWASSRMPWASTAAGMSSADARATSSPIRAVWAMLVPDRKSIAAVCGQRGWRPAAPTPCLEWSQEVGSLWQNPAAFERRCIAAGLRCSSLTYLRICSLFTPCQPRASPLSVRRGVLPQAA